MEEKRNEASGSLTPTTIEGWMKLSSVYFGSATAKKNTNATSINDMFLILSLGSEMGMTPAQTVQNVSIINGRLTVWGDLLLATVLSSGKLGYIKESLEGDLEDASLVAICKIDRNDKLIGEGLEIRFSLEDAKKAKLYPPKSSYSPWGSYTSRMLKMRARSFALRDGFADVLKGVIAREEAQDYYIPPKTEKEIPKKKEIALVAKETKIYKKEAIKEEKKVTPDQFSIKNKQNKRAIFDIVSKRLIDKINTLNETINTDLSGYNLVILNTIEKYIVHLCAKNRKPINYYLDLIPTKEENFWPHFLSWVLEVDPFVFTGTIDVNAKDMVVIAEDKNLDTIDI